MALTYKYAVLVAIPNERRGERVNIGVAVFHGERLDVRLMDADYKLRMLTRQDWSSRLSDAKDRLNDIFLESREPEEVLARFAMFEPLIKTSGLGWLSANDEADYEAQVKQILSSLVGLPERERAASKSTRINTEIASLLRTANVLARPGEGIEHRKVVRDYVIDASEGLRADFALKNGVIHVVATLDLRRQSADLGDAALKSVVLDKASRLHSPERVKTIGAYAVEPGMKEHFAPHLRMFGDYAHDGLLDWTNPADRNTLRKNIFDALEHGDPLI